MRNQILGGIKNEQELKNPNYGSNHNSICYFIWYI